MKKERNYGIDLLRLVFMFMVCVLHVLGQGGVLEACNSEIVDYKVYCMLETLAFCAANGFAIISGYVATDRKMKNEKIVEMWMQAFFYSFVLTAILTLVGINRNWNIVVDLRCMFPILFGNAWYFTSYFILFLTMPILNKFIFGLNVNDAKKAFTIIAIVLMFGGIFSDTLHFSKGYSPIWLMGLYCIGAFAKRVQLFEKKKSKTLVLMWAACILATWAEYCFLDTSLLMNYTSPTIVACGLLMVLLFARIKVDGNMISKLSPLAFGVYLYQVNLIIWEGVLKNLFAFIAQKHIIAGAIDVLKYGFVIFAIGLLVELVRSYVFKLIRIPSLCKLIVKLIDKVIKKCWKIESV